MAAKNALENMVDLKYQNFEWTELLGANRVTLPTHNKNLRKSMVAISNLVQERSYNDLPSELEPYHYYISDSGHSIMAVLEQDWGTGTPLDYELPVPVKYVIEKGWRIQKGFVIVKASYDSIFGFDIDDTYYEF